MYSMIQSRGGKYRTNTVGALPVRTVGDPGLILEGSAFADVISIGRRPFLFFRKRDSTSF